MSSYHDVVTMAQQKRPKSVQIFHSFDKTRAGIVSWFSKEEEWYFTNKRLIFATKSKEVTEEWVQRLNELLQNI